MRSIFFILLLLLGGLQYKLWFGDCSLLQWEDLEDRLQVQTKENEKLQARNKAMEADIVELKSWDQALEEQARYELGMVKENEMYFHFID